MGKIKGKRRKRPAGAGNRVIDLPRELVMPLRQDVYRVLDDLGNAANAVRAARMCLDEGKADEYLSCLKHAGTLTSNARRLIGRLWKGVNTPKPSQKEAKA